MFKINNKHTRNTSRCSGVSIVNFEPISHLSRVLPVLTLRLLTGYWFCPYLLTLLTAVKHIQILVLTMKNVLH